MDRSIKVEKCADDGVRAEDLANFLGDASFSDVTSDDSSGWMHKIDVSNFKELTSGGEYFLTTPQTNLQSTPIYHQQQQGLLLAMPSSHVSTTCGLFRPSSNYACFVNSPNEVCEKFQKPDPVSRADNRLVSPTVSSSTRSYPKPLYSYSCLIALALKNSKTGRLQVSDIYSFMCENFPYFRCAQPGWKNSVRHNLSLNKCFEKIVVETAGGHGRKCCLWTLNPNKIAKMEQEIRKWRDKDLAGVRESLANPDDLNLIELGLKGLPGDHRPVVLQTLPDVFPNSRNAFKSAPPSGYPTYRIRHSPYHYVSTRACFTPPRLDPYDSQYSPPNATSPPAFSTPIRRPIKTADSLLSATSSYSPSRSSQNWQNANGGSQRDFLLCNRESADCGFPLPSSPIAGSHSGSPWKYPNSVSEYSTINVTTPYHTALSATDPNNSLLQTALSMNNYNSLPKTTLQSL